MSNFDNIKQAVKSEMEALKIRITANIISTGKNASGRTINSMQVIESNYGVALINTQKGVKWFGILETGRKAGKVPRGFLAIILKWMYDKGIVADAIPYKRNPSARWQPKYSAQERGQKRMAWFISRKIPEKGTKQHRDGTTDEVYSKEIPKTIEAVKTIVNNFMVEHINLNIKKAIS